MYRIYLEGEDCLGHNNFPGLYVVHGKAHMYYTKSERDRRKRVQDAIRAQWSRPPLEGPLFMHYSYGIPVPKSWSKKMRADALAGKILPSVRPDLSNLFYWMENRVKGIAILDDNLPVKICQEARYAEVASVEILLKPLNPEEEHAHICLSSHPIQGCASTADSVESCRCVLCPICKHTPSK